MKTKTHIAEHNLIVTSEFMRDADGEITHEEIVCETGSLPVLKLADLTSPVNDSDHRVVA